jgi:hypothetical protein
LKTGGRQLGGRNTGPEAQVILQAILPARAGPPCFYKIVRKRLKAEHLIFALWKKIEQRVRKPLKIGRLVLALVREEASVAWEVELDESRVRTSRHKIS